MKVVSKKKLQDDERSVHSLLLERKILATSNCNFIVDLKYAFQNNKSCFFVMGYAPGGDLYSFIQNSHHPDKVRMFKEKGESAPRFVVACVVLAL
jgi:serine/threonine protein kinase